MSEPPKKRKDTSRLFRIGLILTPMSFILLAASTLIQDYPLYTAPNGGVLLSNLIHLELGKYWGQILIGVGLYTAYVSSARDLTFLRRQREQSAAKHDLAPESLQPKPDPLALSLPFHVWLRPSRFLRRIYWLSALIVFIILLSSVLIELHSSTTNNADPQFVFGSFFIIILSSVTCAILLFEAVFRTHYAITEQGASISRFGNTRQIAWPEAHNFVVGTLQASPKGPFQLYFQIEGRDGQKIAWGPLNKKMYSVFTSQQRPLANEAFNAEIVPQINALVAARTGLALIDQRLDASVTLPASNS